MFPGDGGANGLDADVPAVLPVGMTVDYMCTNPTYMLTGTPPYNNECNDQGVYVNPTPTCVPTAGKLKLVIANFSFEVYVYVFIFSPLEPDNDGEGSNSRLNHHT